MIERVVLCNLPHDVKGFSRETDDGEKIIILNARLNKECNVETFIHEVQHCRYDYEKSECVSELELKRHNVD